MREEVDNMILDGAFSLGLICFWFIIGRFTSVNPIYLLLDAAVVAGCCEVSFAVYKLGLEMRKEAE